MMRTMAFLAVLELTSVLGFAQGDVKAPAESKTAAVVEKKFYRLNFVILDLDNGHAINNRSYSLVVEDVANSRIPTTGSIRAGARVPTPDNSGRWDMKDVGVNIDCKSVSETAAGVSLNLKAEISNTLIETHKGDDGTYVPPVIRRNQWESAVTVPMNKPTVVFSSDDPESKRTLQLQLTVAPVR